MRRTAGFLGLVLVLWLPVPAHAAAILTNGSFELGPVIPTADINILGGSTAITGWTVTGDRIDYLGPPWDVADGKRAIDLDGNNGIGGITQTFTTTRGTAYMLSFDLSGNPQGGPTIKTVRVGMDGVMHDYTFNTSGQTREHLRWQTHHFVTVAAAAATTLSFTSLSPSGNSYGALIDNVSVRAVPEPSTLLFLGISFVALRSHAGRGVRR